MSIQKYRVLKVGLFKIHQFYGIPSQIRETNPLLLIFVLALHEKFRFLSWIFDFSPHNKVYLIALHSLTHELRPKGLILV